MATVIGSSQNRVWLGIVLVWTLFMLFIAWQQITASDDAILKLAEKEATVSFNKDLVYRRWAAGHGGVYVPITEETPPSPYLSHIPERDITTASGRQLTLIDPAYMTRQVHELAHRQYDVKGHFTSLKPIRPENAPDAWERESLQTIERSHESQSSVELYHGEAHLRMMLPLETEERCLKCHASQGYQLGDIRGGISVSVPLAGYNLIQAKSTRTTIMTNLTLWLLGMYGLFWARKLVNHQFTELDLLRRAAETSEKKFHLLFDNTSYGCAVVDVETGELLDCNPKLLEMVERSEGELIGQSQAILHPQTDRPSKFSECFLRYKSLPDGTLLETQIITKRGEVRDVEIKANCLEIDGRLVMHEFFYDIVERKKNEERAQRQQYFLEKAQQLGQIGSWELDLQQNRLIWTDETCRIFGVNLGGLRTYEDFLSLVHPDDRDYVNCKWQAATAGESYDLEHRIIVADEIKWVRQKADLEFDADGQALTAIGFVQDITAQKRVEEALRQSEDKFFKSFDNAPIMMTITSVADGTCLEVNQKFC